MMPLLNGAEKYCRRQTTNMPRRRRSAIPRFESQEHRLRRGGFGTKTPGNKTCLLPLVS
jgi:hypothetical protein